MKQLLYFLIWIIVGGVAWTFIAYWFKGWYVALRGTWILLREALGSPLAMWEFTNGSKDDKREKYEPLVVSIMGDGIYKALDWFSQPADWFICKICNSWYLLRHQAVLRRWLRWKLFCITKKRKKL